jgi:hypothetical protein
VGQAFLFLGGFEEGYLRHACHSKPSMVVNLSNPSTKIYVVFRKLCLDTSRNRTVQKRITALPFDSVSKEAISVSAVVACERPPNGAQMGH